MRIRRAIATALITLVLACTAAASGCRFVSTGGLSGVIEPTIKPSASEQGVQSVTREWEFEGDRVRITVPVDQAVYAGAKTAEKRAIFLGDAKNADWVPDYYRAFISERHQEAFYASLLDALHATRKRLALDDSRYVELVTTMAQGIEYRTDPVALAPKFPVETFGDGFGDCDDKALLAAAVLARDGYDVSILMFGPEKHVAMGIRAPGLDYKKTGYAYVELAGSSLVGQVPEQLAGGIKLTSQPVVIKIGTGSLSYGEGRQIAYIEKRFSELRAAEKRGQARIESDSATLKAENTSLQAERSAFQSMTDPVQQAAAIQAYNDHVRRVNDLAVQTNDRIAKYNALVDVEKYVVSHTENRPEVYRRLKDAAF